MYIYNIYIQDAVKVPSTEILSLFALFTSYTCIIYL